MGPCLPPSLKLRRANSTTPGEALAETGRRDDAGVCRNNCLSLDSISASATDLPVALIGRRCEPLSRRANQKQNLGHPVPDKGAFRDRHERWVRGAVDALARVRRTRA